MPTLSIVLKCDVNVYFHKHFLIPSTPVMTLLSNSLSRQFNLRANWSTFLLYTTGKRQLLNTNSSDTDLLHTGGKGRDLSPHPSRKGVFLIPVSLSPQWETSHSPKKYQEDLSFIMETWANSILTWTKITSYTFFDWFTTK